MRRIPALGYLLCALLLITVTDAPAQQSTDRYQLALVTVGPGELYFERFGHNALLVIDRATGEQVTYNYGIFDFEQDNFFLDFARGRMTYRMAAFDGAADIPYYIRSDRQVDVQILDLDEVELNRVLAHLAWNRRPDNSSYSYHYFNDNCSTRVRDALDLALDGALARRFQPQAAGHNLRYHVNRLTSPQLWAYLGTHVALGREIDAPLTRWGEFFLPMELRDSLQDYQRPDGRLLVRQRYVLHHGAVVEPDQPPRWWPWFLLAGLMLAAMQWRLAGRRSAALWWYFNGAVGALLASLWLWTEHQSAHANENLLLFSPLALLAGLCLSLGKVTQARLLALFLALTAVLAAALTSSPWLTQSNLEFILFVVPIHLAGWMALRRA